MAKQLTFTYKDATFLADLAKVDRSKLYGKSEVVTTTPDGEVCVSANILPELSLIIPSGTTKAAVVDASGKWLDRSELTAVNALDGTPLERYESSFNAPIVLDEEASEDEFLDNVWESVYQLDCPELAKEVGDKIFRFCFNYNAGVNRLSAFLLVSDGNLFMLAGSKAEFPMVTLAQEAVLDDVNDESETDDEDEMDFSMM